MSTREEMYMKWVEAEHEKGEFVAKQLRARWRFDWAQDVDDYARGTPYESATRSIRGWLAEEYIEACEAVKKAEAKASAARAKAEAPVAEGGQNE